MYVLQIIKNYCQSSSPHWLPVRKRGVYFKDCCPCLEVRSSASTTTTPQKILQQFCVAVDSVQGRPRLRYASTGCICIAIMGADMRHQSDSADLRYLWAVGLPLPRALTDTRVLTYLLTHLQFKS